MSDEKPPRHGQTDGQTRPSTPVQTRTPAHGRSHKQETNTQTKTNKGQTHAHKHTNTSATSTHTRTHYKSRQAHKHKPQTNTHLPPTCTSADGLPHANRARCTHHGMASAHAHLRASCRERRSSYMSCVGTMHVILPIYMAMAHT